MGAGPARAVGVEGRWKRPLSLVVVLQGDPELAEIVGAAGPPGRLACRLHCGQQQAHEDSEDGDHHEEFDEREPPGVWQTGPSRSHIRTSPPRTARIVRTREHSGACPRFRAPLILLS